MNLDDLDVPCGYCCARRRREIPGGTWLAGPACPECSGAGYLITSPDAERLLAFLLRHIPQQIDDPRHPGLQATK